MQLVGDAVLVLAVGRLTAAGRVNLAHQRQPVLVEQRAEELLVLAPRRRDRLDRVKALALDPLEERVPAGRVVGVLDAPERLHNF
eukprot:1919121-Prymnesium_polylepis.1